MYKESEKKLTDESAINSMTHNMMFETGKYIGLPFNEVAMMDPDYIVEKYESQDDHAGIPQDVYHLCVACLPVDPMDGEWDDANAGC